MHICDVCYTDGNYPTEKKEQCKLFQWIERNHKIKNCAFHIPNEGKRTPKEGNILKKAGLRPGVFDNFIAHANDLYFGLFIELKARDKNGVYRKPTNAQLLFMVDMHQAGYQAVVANGADEAIEIIENYLKIPLFIDPEKAANDEQLKMAAINGH